ncbi:MAG: ribonuclease III [Acidobacteriaceae bacterium]|nr:ribonuclease III [Acidobacteriaceae bacterium]
MAELASALEEKLGYRFREPELLARALTHRSRWSEQSHPREHRDNEQLEFLGDSILGFVTSEYLFMRYPECREGQLSQLKSHLVSSTHLHRCAVRLGLGEFMFLGKGEERSGGRERKNLLSDALEAVIAAIHLDGGIDVARTFVQDHILAVAADENLHEISSLNYKSALQEKAQALGLPTPKYVTVGTSGPEHAKVFTVEARMGDRVGKASGSSKKAASQKAAELLINEMLAPANGGADDEVGAGGRS